MQNAPEPFSNTMSSSPGKTPHSLDSPLRRALEQPPLKRFRVSCLL